MLWPSLTPPLALLSPSFLLSVAEKGDACSSTSLSDQNTIVPFFSPERAPKDNVVSSSSPGSLDFEVLSFRPKNPIPLLQLRPVASSTRNPHRRRWTLVAVHPPTIFGPLHTAVDRRSSSPISGAPPLQVAAGTQTIFLKPMHNLSVLLLSTCNGGSSLHEYEEELLQSVIQNLEAASSKRSKVKLKADDGLSNFSQIRLENMSCLRNNFWVAMPEHPENTDSEFKTPISKALTKLPGDKMLDDAEVSQVLIYKNLWIEAEASACKLKYELQLARTKLATMKGHNNTQTVLVDSSEGGKASSSTISNSKPQNNHAKGSIACAATFQCHEGDSGDSQSPVVMVNRSILNGVDADVFARLGVLRSRIDNVSSFCEEQQEASKKSFAVEDAVLARLGVLKSCPDGIISLDLESSKHQLDACTNRSDEVDDAVMARLRILKSRPDNLSSLGQESSKHQLDECTNRADKVDDAVIARLRILKCRNDNINSLGDVSKQHEEACNDQSNWDKDGVVGKIQYLSGGIGNTTSIAEGCPKPLNSDDLADHSEGQDSVGGLETIGDATGGAEKNVNGSVGTADVAAPNRCKVPSDEVNDKSAVQREDGFVVNHAWPQTTGDSHGCTAGSQETPLISSSVHQYDRFPPEWVHVLKENFLHPGKYAI